LLSLLEETGADYCVIGGLAVNAYTEPVVSLDLDLVAIASHIPNLRTTAETRGMKIQEFEHSLNLSISGSDLRIQIQTDPRYQEFLSRREKRNVLGYEMDVASLEDVLMGRFGLGPIPPSEEQTAKDLADILRLVETHPELRKRLPPSLQDEVE
jgi:hypothetical protein